MRRLLLLMAPLAIVLGGCGSVDQEFRHRVESTEVDGKAVISQDGSTGIGGRVKVTFRDPGTGQD